MTPSAGGVSSLQRRLAVVEADPDRPWIHVAENIPEWPAGSDPLADLRIPGGATGYAPAAGVPELRSAVAQRERAHCGGAVDERQVVISAGAMQGIGLVLRDCLDQGYRRVLYPQQTFVGVHDAVRTSGLEPVPVRIADRDAVEGYLDDRTVVYLNLPHNPSGSVLTADLVATMRRWFSRRQGAVVILDAVYDAFDFGPDPVTAPIDIVAEGHLVIVNSMSKNYGRPGDRVGWVVTDPARAARLTARQEWESICVAPSQQHLAVAALKAGNAGLVDAVRAGRAALRELSDAYSWCRGLCLSPGGTQVMIPLPVDDVEAFADHALLTEGLVLTTSSNYAPAAGEFIRLPTGVPAARIAAALTALDAALRSWPTADERGIDRDAFVAPGRTSSPMTHEEVMTMLTQ